MVWRERVNWAGEFGIRSVALSDVCATNCPPEHVSRPLYCHFDENMPGREYDSPLHFDHFAAFTAFKIYTLSTNL